MTLRPANTSHVCAGRFSAAGPCLSTPNRSRVSGLSGRFYAVLFLLDGDDRAPSLARFVCHVREAAVGELDGPNVPPLFVGGRSWRWGACRNRGYSHPRLDLRCCTP